MFDLGWRRLREAISVWALVGCVLGEDEGRDLGSDLVVQWQDQNWVQG